MLRVLHATPAFAPAYGYGGPIRSIEGLVVELHRRGTDVRVLATDADGARRLDVGRGWQRWRDVPVLYLPRWAGPDLTPAFLSRSIVEARRADLVHILGLFSAPSMAALAGALVAGVPAILSPRGALEGAALTHGAPSKNQKKRAWLAAFGPLLARLAAIHATSDAEAASVERALGDFVPGARRVPIRVVPNGTDLEPREAAVARKARVTRGLRPRIGALGRIHSIKGLELLLAAADRLFARGVDFELVMAGPAPDAAYLAELEGTARRSPARDRISFAPALSGEAKLDFLASCRVLCLPSASENFGNVVVEAMGALTPVVASRGTPWAELETVGAGRWIERSDVTIADAVEPYLRDPGVSSAAGEEGRALVEARYQWSAVAARMEDVYREVLSADRGRARGPAR